jgi:phage tail-like protein
MRKTRRWEREPEREPGEPSKPRLDRLDTSTRAGVLEELQRAGGNNALQRVVAAAQLQRQPRTVGRFVAGLWALTLDGTTVPLISVDGGGASSDVITHPDPGGVQRKRITGVHYDPFVLRVGLDMGSELSDWIQATIDRKHARRDLVLHHLDSSGEEQVGLELKDALMTGMEVPALDAADEDPAVLKVSLAPGAVRRRTGSGTKLKPKGSGDPLKPSTMRFEVSSIGPVPGVRSVAPWTFSQKTVTDSTARGRERENLPATTTLGNLLVTIAETGAKSGTKSFDAWFEESAIKGTEDERTAVLTVSSRGGRKLELSFSGVGIFSADQVARSDAGGRRYGFYVEGATLKIT